MFLIRSKYDKDTSKMVKFIFEEMKQFMKKSEFSLNDDIGYGLTYADRSLVLSFPKIEKIRGNDFTFDDPKSNFANHLNYGEPVYFEFIAGKNDTLLNYDDKIYTSYFRIYPSLKFHDPKRIKEQMKAMVNFVETGSAPNSSLCLRDNRLSENSSKDLTEFFKKDIPSAMDINRCKGIANIINKYHPFIAIELDDRLGMLYEHGGGDWTITIAGNVKPKDKDFFKKNFDLITKNDQSTEIFDWWRYLEDEEKALSEVWKDVEYFQWIYEVLVSWMKSKNIFNKWTGTSVFG